MSAEQYLQDRRTDSPTDDKSDASYSVEPLRRNRKQSGMSSSLAMMLLAQRDQFSGNPILTPHRFSMPEAGFEEEDFLQRCVSKARDKQSPAIHCSGRRHRVERTRQ